jgi:hypothetical protein
MHKFNFMTSDECEGTKRNACVWPKFQFYRLTRVLQNLKPTHIQQDQRININNKNLNKPQSI